MYSLKSFSAQIIIISVGNVFSGFLIFLIIFGLGTLFNAAELQSRKIEGPAAARSSVSVALTPGPER